MLLAPFVVFGRKEVANMHLGRTFVGDGNGCVNRPDPRIADSAQILAALLHPDRFLHGSIGAERWP
jgi:hypothetical protein